MGIDEVGRGSWAGPLVAAAVILPKDFCDLVPAANKLADSKMLSKKLRQQLATLINDKALASGLGWVTSSEIDRFGLAWALTTAMSSALAKISEPYDQIVVDGNVDYLNKPKIVETMIGADGLVPAVSAASILAKVARDEYMIKQDGNYPQYGFDSNVGYGTKHHRAMLDRYGVCNLHRKSFKPIRHILLKRNHA